MSLHGSTGRRRMAMLIQSMTMPSASEELVARATQLHRRAIVVDTHCDTTQRLMDARWDLAARHSDGHVDIPRLREGGIDAVFLAVWTPAAGAPRASAATARDQIRRIREVIDENRGSVAPASTAEDVRRAKAAGLIALLIGIEGGHQIEDSLDVLRDYHDLGAGYLTLTHAFHTNWADSSGVHEALEPRHGGLTDFGRQVVRELNLLGMMVDVSHSADTTVRDVLEIADAPVVATHSACRAIHAHRRNLPDELMRAIAETGGVVQINFSAGFLDPSHPPIDPHKAQRWFADGLPTDRPICNHVTPLSLLADHLDHAIQLIGPEHVGLGSDFDGVPSLPRDLEDCSKLPNLTAEMLSRGYSEDDLTKVLGENVLRVMEACRAKGRRETPLTEPDRPARR